MPPERYVAGEPVARSAWALLLGPVLGGGAAVCVLWVAAVANEPLSSTGQQAGAAGRLGGLLASYLCVVQILLMTRISALEHRVGTGRLTRCHALVGRALFVALAVHILGASEADAARQHAPFVGSLLGMPVSYPRLGLAAIGTLLLVVVGALSVRAARRRLRYETWYHIHLTAYVGIGLAFGHELLGPDLVNAPPARWALIALYAATALLLVWFRLVVPFRSSLRHRLRVQSVTIERAGVVSVRVTGRRLAEMRAQPGQFFRWRFLTRDGWFRSHPFSLSAAPNALTMRVTVKAVGDGTRRLEHLRPGVRVIAAGPYGSLTPGRRRRRQVLLLAGGMGIAPLRALLDGLPAQPGDMTLVYRAVQVADLVLRAEIERIAEVRGVTVHYLLGPHTGADPMTAERLAELVPGLPDHDVYLCGPPGMVGAATRELRAAGVPAGAIHSEGLDY